MISEQNHQIWRTSTTTYKFIHTIVFEIMRRIRNTQPSEHQLLEKYNPITGKRSNFMFGYLCIRMNPLLRFLKTYNVFVILKYFDIEREIVERVYVEIMYSVISTPVQKGSHKKFDVYTWISLWRYQVNISKLGGTMSP